MPSITEENYLKAIFRLTEEKKEKATTSAIAELLEGTASAVTDMLKKLAEKAWIHYEKYQAVTLTELGRQTAVQIIRKHRLWEVFLVKKLGYRWDQVHQIAEQLEHVQSEDLIERLESFLGYPDSDPHGDPIPDRMGQWKTVPVIALVEGEMNKGYQMRGISDHSTAFMQYLDKIGLAIGNELTILERIEYDGSLHISITRGETKGGRNLFLSKEVAKSLLVIPI